MVLSQVQARVIGEVRSGVSKTSGNQWRSLDLIVGWSEPMEGGWSREHLLQGTLHGESIDRFLALNPVAGETVLDLEVSFSTRSWNDRVYNDVAFFL